jgi:hypothetical protein
VFGAPDSGGLPAFQQGRAAKQEIGTQGGQVCLEAVSEQAMPTAQDGAVWDPGSLGCLRLSQGAHGARTHQDPEATGGLHSLLT